MPMKINKTCKSNNKIDPMLSLINIIFLLLMFFMLAGQIEQPLFVKSLPKQEQELVIKNLDEIKAKSLQVRKYGRIFNNGREVELNDLKGLYLGAEVVFIFAEPDVSIGNLAPIKNKLETLGVKKLTFINELLN